ncbi:MAG: hypothetical protein SFZ23_08785 [Planctomycetota bacterium]|nr:hypothetical protein [Planctomycetota bacterium]
MKVIVASLAGAICVAASSARAEIIHASNLEWYWPSWETSFHREIAGGSFTQDYSRHPWRRQAWITLAGDSTVSFGLFDIAPGFEVGPGDFWSGGALILELGGGGYYGGIFVGENDDGLFIYPIVYLGLRVATAQPESFLYGWMRIESGGDPAVGGFIITEYAYQSAPDTPILAGAIPAPGAAGVLALGGLTASRRRR